ncbi:hypothetical protein VOLCADRAFT_98375 [Volvox carteri f. nagariensis]|uniref:EF-hand domain-containing protein n=1 Tax=Volvox carteri f. nagariensis TaxID=3068 RepID=D8UF64_VOLCA|nr:uncharacterized protein VOLCADRAFT_98375 [Volvox carteri f. nagariensis]EFJ41662.1 hypothetical protein VOLCADRAFT_98375 [Volvox carteri f. nagariensis]|eukprot:XP_002957318.1 hypothetical protein VOLCADRAFT_98375 [Volvox carteri f. nagariensis]
MKRDATHFGGILKAICANLCSRWRAAAASQGLPTVAGAALTQPLQQQAQRQGHQALHDAYLRQWSEALRKAGLLCSSHLQPPPMAEGAQQAPPAPAPLPASDQGRGSGGLDIVESHDSLPNADLVAQNLAGNINAIAIFEKDEDDDDAGETEDDDDVAPIWYERPAVLAFLVSVGLGLGLLLVGLVLHIRYRATYDAFRWCYFFAALPLLYYILAYASKHAFMLLEWLFFRESLFYLDNLQRSALWLLFFLALLPWYQTVFRWAWCHNTATFRRRCESPAYLQATSAVWNVLLCLMLFCLANLLKAVLAKLLTTHFYRTAHFKKLKSALEKEYALQVLSRPRRQVISERWGQQQQQQPPQQQQLDFDGNPNPHQPHHHNAVWYNLASYLNYHHHNNHGGSGGDPTAAAIATTDGAAASTAFHASRVPAAIPAEQTVGAMEEAAEGQPEPTATTITNVSPEVVLPPPPLQQQQPLPLQLPQSTPPRALQPTPTALPISSVDVTVEAGRSAAAAAAATPPAVAAVSSAELPSRSPSPIVANRQLGTHVRTATADPQLLQLTAPHLQQKQETDACGYTVAAAASGGGGVDPSGISLDQIPAAADAAAVLASSGEGGVSRRPRELLPSSSLPSLAQQQLPACVGLFAPPAVTTGLRHLTDAELEKVRTAIVIKTQSALISKYTDRSDEDMAKELGRVKRFAKALFYNVLPTVTSGEGASGGGAGGGGRRDYLILDDFLPFFEEAEGAGTSAGGWGGSGTPAAAAGGVGGDGRKLPSTASLPHLGQLQQQQHQSEQQHQQSHHHLQEGQQGGSARYGGSGGGSGVGGGGGGGGGGGKSLTRNSIALSVDPARAARQRARQRAAVEAAQKAFAVFDADGNGEVSRAEVKEAVVNIYKVVLLLLVVVVEVLLVVLVVLVLEVVLVVVVVEVLLVLLVVLVVVVVLVLVVLVVLVLEVVLLLLVVVVEVLLVVLVVLVLEVVLVVVVVEVLLVVLVLLVLEVVLLLLVVVVVEVLLVVLVVLVLDVVLLCCLKDTDTIVQSLEFGIGGIIHFVFAAVYLLIWGVDLLTGFSTFSTTVLALTFVFGNSVKNMFESMLFLFVTHPYDVGDCIVIGTDMYRVKKISLLYTDLVKYTGERVYMPNTSLIEEGIINWTRSKSKSESCRLVCDLGVAWQVREDIQTALRAYAKEHPGEFDGEPSCNFRELVDPLKVVLVCSWTYNFAPDEFSRLGPARNGMLFIVQSMAREHRLHHTTFMESYVNT